MFVLVFLLFLAFISCSFFFYFRLSRFLGGFICLLFYLPFVIGTLFLSLAAAAPSIRKLRLREQENIDVISNEKSRERESAHALAVCAACAQALSAACTHVRVTCSVYERTRNFNSTYGRTFNNLKTKIMGTLVRKLGRPPNASPRILGTKNRTNRTHRLKVFD